MTQQKKICSPKKGCGLEKDVSQFYRQGNGHNRICKECHKKLYKESSTYNEQKRRQKKEYRLEIQTKKGYIKHMLIRAKKRAKTKGLKFNLTEEDIVIPDKCPILCIPIEYKYTGQRGGQTANSPSVDRIDNNKGYVKGNIRIISNKANALKSDMTIAQVKRLLNYMEGRDNEIEYEPNELSISVLRRVMSVISK